MMEYVGQEVAAGHGAEISVETQHTLVLFQKVLKFIILK